MEFFSLEVNSTIIKSFRSYELALKFIESYTCTDIIKIYLEEYPDDFHGQSDSHGYKTLIFSNN